MSVNEEGDLYKHLKEHNPDKNFDVILCNVLERIFKADLKRQNDKLKEVTKAVKE